MSQVVRQMRHIPLSSNRYSRWPSLWINAREKELKAKKRSYQASIRRTGIEFPEDAIEFDARIEEITTQLQNVPDQSPSQLE